MHALTKVIVPLSLIGVLAACGGGTESTPSTSSPTDVLPSATTEVLPSATAEGLAPVGLVGEVGDTLTSADGVAITVTSVAVNGAPGAESWTPEDEIAPADLPQGAVWPVDGYRVSLTADVANNSADALSIPADFVALEVTPADAEGFKIQCTAVTVSQAPDMQPGIAAGASMEWISRFVCPGQRAEEPFEAIYSLPSSETRLVFTGQLPYQSTTDGTAGQPG